MVNSAVGRPNSVILITRQEEAATHIDQQEFDLATAITLASVSSATTTARTDLRPPGVVRQLKSATEHNITVGGADPAGQAIKAGLVTSCSCSRFPPSSEGPNKRSPTVSVRI